MNEERLDYFNQELEIGDTVLAADGHLLHLYKVIKITPKMIRVVRLDATVRTELKGVLRYAVELCKIDNELVSYHIMRMKQDKK